MWTVLKALALRMAVGRTLGGMLATLFLLVVPLAGVLKVIGLPILIVCLVKWSRAKPKPPQAPTSPSDIPGETGEAGLP